MAMKQFQCRTHGGIFKMPTRRGRPPVQCTAQYPCTRRTDDGHRAAHAAVIPSRAANVASEIKNARLQAVPAPTDTPPGNASTTRAMAAKRQLEAVGWTVKGRAWAENDTACAEIIATREAEFIMIVWKDGTPVQQQYTMWNETNSRTLAPRRKMNYDPVALTDAELVEVLRGERVTWWNRLSNGIEEAIVPDRLSVEHVYEHGKDDPSMRIVKFCGRGSMFRAFHVGALLSIGAQ